MLRQDRRRGADEDGQVLVLAALMLTVLLGMVALALDIGRLSVTRRQAQNSADAAAYAGAAFLPSSRADALAAARDYGARNGFAGVADTIAPVVETATRADDTIRVTVSRDVPYTFGRVLGLTSKEISATARVRAYVATGLPEGAQGAFPFAVWGGNLDWASERQPGRSVTYRANNWDRQVDANVRCGLNDSGPNCRWRQGGGNNSFKGYLHQGNGWFHVAPQAAPLDAWDIQGGNAQGTEYRDAINAVAAAGGVIRIPIIDRVRNDQGTGFYARVPGFLCVEPAPIGNGIGADWTGTIVDARADPRCTALDGAGGGTPPYGGHNVYAVKLLD